MGDYGDVYDKTQILSQMWCETTSSVKECALRARSGDVHVARVVSLVVDAVVGLTLGLIAHVVIVVFVVAYCIESSVFGGILFTDPSRIRTSTTLDLRLLFPCKHNPDGIPDAFAFEHGHVSLPSIDELHSTICQSRGTDTIPLSHDHHIDPNC